MRVFDRGKELVGDERVKEIEESLWYREMLSVEMVFGSDEVEEDEEEVDWREVGNYWELNDGIGRKNNKSVERKWRKGKFGWEVMVRDEVWKWVEVNGKKVEVKMMERVWEVKDLECGEMWSELGVCMCKKCGG
jgi:hypothetical protein